MEDKDKQEPMGMSAMFPGTSPERVEKLLEDSDFMAQQALVNLSLEMRRKQEEGVDVSDLSGLLDVAYAPAMRALGEKLARAGWGNAEQSAAHMVAKGSVKIR